MHMRYKVQATNKIGQFENMLRTVDFMVSRGESQDSILQYITEMKNKLEELREMISLEHDEFLLYRD